MTFVHEHLWLLRATPDAVFAALTDERQLSTWFAEHVDIGHAVDEPFRFWGRHSLETPTSHSATQRVTHWEKHSALSFSWRVGDVDTEVRLSLGAVDEGCRLTLQHHVLAALPHTRPKELIHDYWLLAIGNLSEHLAGGDGVALPDFMDTSPEVRQVIIFDAPPEIVFQTLVTPSLVNVWFDAKESVIEPHVGGQYAINWRYKVDGRDVMAGPTRIVAIVENELLTLDWPDWRGDLTVNQQTITFRLERVNEKTRVTFVHAGFGRTADIGAYPCGWRYFLDKVREVATGRR